MDLLKRRQDLKNAEKQALAQLNAIAGQLQLVEELLAEQNGTPPPADGEENKEQPPDEEKDKPLQKLDS